MHALPNNLCVRKYQRDFCLVSVAVRQKVDLCSPGAPRFFKVGRTYF